LLVTLREGRGVTTKASLRGKFGHSIPVRLQTILLRNDSGHIQGAVERYSIQYRVPRGTTTAKANSAQQAAWTR